MLEMQAFEERNTVSVVMDFIGVAGKIVFKHIHF